MAIDFILIELLWISPIVVSLVSIFYLGYCFSRYSKASVILRCFSLSLFIILIGALGSWRSGLEIWKIMGMASDISLDMLYGGWKHSWWPLITAGISILPLLGLAIAAYYQKEDLPSRKPIETAILMAYPAAAILLLFLLGITIEFIYEPLYNTYSAASLDRWVYQLMSIGVLGYFFLCSLGIPYSIIWGIYLKRWRRFQPNNRFRKLLTIFYITFTIIAVAFTVLFIVSISRGHNPFL